MQYSLKNGRDSVKAGSAEAKLQKEKWKKDIPFGLSYASQFFNTVTYGLRKKRFTLGSADSGTGKIMPALIKSRSRLEMEERN